MKINKILTIILFIVFSTLTNMAYAETLKFSASTYEEEVKKGKAHGVGVFTFSDGSTYEGRVSKNRIHGKGKYTDSQGNVFEGKFKYGRFVNKINDKTRNIIKIKPKTGLESHIEMKGTGSLSNKWFDAVKNSSGTYEMSAKGKKDMDMAKAAGGSGSGGSGGSSGGSGC